MQLEQSTWISIPGFLQKNKKTERKQSQLKKEKRLEKQYFNKKWPTSNITVFTTKKTRKIKRLESTIGESGYRSRNLPHAKWALYHLS